MNNCRGTWVQNKISPEDNDVYKQWEGMDHQEERNAKMFWYAEGLALSRLDQNCEIQHLESPVGVRKYV